MYNLEGSQLRVCGKYLRQERNREFFRSTRIILLQHILPTTQEYIRLLAEAGAEIYSVFCKPLSVNQAVMRDLTASGFRLIQKSYHELETTSYLRDHLKEAFDKCEQDGKKILVLEVGGYFAQALSELGETVSNHMAGVVEDTTFGHNRYKLSAQIFLFPSFR